MSDNSLRIPASSQTVGPYFRIGLEYLVNRKPVPSLVPAGMIEIRGRVLDRDGVPVPDAMLEFCSGAGARTLLDGRDAESGFRMDSDAWRRMIRASSL